MVAEESGMKISASVCGETAENPLPAPEGAQIALAFDSEGNHQTVIEAPDQHDGRRSRIRKSRFDTRRTAELLGERGRLPAESLHLITRRTLGEAVAYIRKTVPGVSHDWAANYYLRCVELLLPYCHVKQSDIDQPGALNGVGSLVAGHFLAASALAQSSLAAPNGRGARLSVSQQLIDSQDDNASNGLRGGNVMQTVSSSSGSVVTLPPRGRD